MTADPKAPFEFAARANANTSALPEYGNPLSGAGAKTPDAPSSPSPDLAAVKAALKPFTRMKLLSNWSDNSILSIGDYATLTVGDFRRAAEVYATLTKDPSDAD